MRRLLCFFLLLNTLLFASCATGSTNSWQPVDGPYSWEAVASIYDWIGKNMQSETLPSSTIVKDIQILQNLVKGTLTWAYSYGSSFDSDDFLRHFSNKDDSLRMLRLEDGGLLFVLDVGFFKICRDTSSPEGRIFPENQIFPYPRNRWLATVFNESSDITFYFSSVGPTLSQGRIREP